MLGNAGGARSTREGKGKRKRLSNIGRAVLGNAEARGVRARGKGNASA